MDWACAFRTANLASILCHCRHGEAFLGGEPIRSCKLGWTRSRIAESESFSVDLRSPWLQSERQPDNSLFPHDFFLAPRYPCYFISTASNGEHSFRHFQETFASLAAHIPDRTDGGVRRVGRLCPPVLDQSATFTVRRHDCRPHGGQRSHSSLHRQSPPVRAAPVSVELGRILSGPNRDRCDLRRGRGFLPGVDQS
jgi:hypothetical protein